MTGGSTNITHFNLCLLRLPKFFLELKIKSCNKLIEGKTHFNLINIFRCIKINYSTTGSCCILFRNYFFIRLAKLILKIVFVFITISSQGQRWLFCE
jgi:hypothetical protein